MIPAETSEIIQRAKRIYAERPQPVLEAQHRGRFVAVEPESGDHFLGGTFDEAVTSARRRYPARLSHTIRVGHRAAFHIGGVGW